MNDIEKVDYIIENFNYKKVRKCMKALNWEWYGVGIPKKSHMKKTSRDLLLMVISEYNKNGERTEISTGGFKATKDQLDLRLEFVLEESGSEYL